MKDELVRISIENFKNNSKSIIEKSFSEEEKKEMAGMKLQSIAARYALKTALINLFPLIDFQMKNIKIGKNCYGAPIINEFPEKLIQCHPELIDRIRVSISHSKLYAAGLAVLFGDSDE